MHGDVVAAARALYVQPVNRRNAVMQRLLQEATWADRYRAMAGRMHPLWGDGSLMAAALNRHPAPEPGLADSDYCGCLAQVLEALMKWRSEQQVTVPLHN